MIKVNSIEKRLLAAVFLIALITLIGWYSNNLNLTRVSRLFLPMAPLTAILFILIGSANYLWLFHRKKTWLVLAKIIVILILVIQTVIAIDFFYLNYTLNVEALLINTSELFKNQPIGRISQWSILLFNFTAISFLIIDKNHKLFYRNVYGILTLIIFGSSAFFLLSYIERFPIFFNERVIPISLLGAFCFWLLSLIQLKIINFEIWPFKLFNEKSTYNIIAKTLIPLVIGLIVLQEIIENYFIVDKKSPIVSMLFMVIAIFLIIFMVYKITSILGDSLDKTVKSLKISEQKFESLFNNATIGLYQSTPDGKVLTANKALLDMLQYSSLDELLKIDITKGSYVDHNKRKEFKRKLTQYSEITNFESQWRSKNGNIIHVKEGARAVKDKNGHIIRYDGVVEDITELKKIETVQNIILNIANASQNEDNLNVIMRVVQNELGRIVDAKNFYVAIYNDENDSINRIFYRDEKDEIINFPASKTATGMVIKQGKSYLLRKEDTSRLVKENKINVVGEISKVWLGVPLIVKGKSIGAFVVQSYESENAYNENDKEVLEIISHQISTSIERQQSEKILQDVEQKQRNILEKSTNLFYSHDINHQLNYMSPQVKDILGYEVEEALVKWTKLISGHPINELGFGSTMRAIETGITQPPYELELIRKDGRKIWVEVREAPVVEYGKTVAIVGSLNDITKHKRDVQIQNIILNIANASQTSLNLGKLLQLIQKELERIVDSKNFYVAIYNEEEDTIHLPYFQDEYDDITDFPAKGSLTGLVIKEGKSMLLNNADINKLVEEKNLVHTGPDCKVWLGLPLKSKEKIIGAIVVQSYDDVNAYSENDIDILEIIAYQIGISIERKLNEEELIKAKEKAEENEEQLKRIANNFADGMIYQIAMIDENQRKFNYVSDSVVKLYGCTPEQVKENSDLIYSKVHPDDLVNLIKIEKEALKNFSTFKSECRVFNPDGSIRWSYFVSQPRLINEIVCWDGIEIDISDRKKIENELVISKEIAEESDRLKSAFLANMSHEIRTPMNAIMGFSELLNANNLSEAKKEKYHEIISNSGKRLMNIVTDIVDISKLDSNQLNLHLELININELLDILYNQFNITAKNKSIQLSLHKGLSIDEGNINTDETRLCQVITNLLENALKFTQSGSIELGYQLKENELLFYVKDTGVGIRKKHHQLIFDRFSQSDNEILKVKEGAGLGLSISKGIIELFGGVIWVESELGKGSTFYFTIPYKNGETTMEPINKNNLRENVQEIESNATSKTILIAEDEYTNYMFLEAILEALPFKLVHVENGKDAVDFMNSNAKIDLILMDINMPVMNGLEATIAIRKIHPNIPIIAVTAYAMATDREKAIAHGCTDYLTKPVSKKVLLETINKYI